MKPNRAALRLTLALALLVTALPATLADSYVTILHFNDYHGYLMPVEVDGKSVGGLARLATAVREVRAWNDPRGNTTLLLVAGDILQGTPFSMAYKGEPDVLGLNLMGVDAMAVGNHEFDFGQDNLHKLMELARFPIISANIYVRETSERLADAFVRFTLPDGTPGAIFGLTSEDTPVETMPVNVVGLEFTSPYEEARKVLDEIGDTAQLLIAVTHIGHEEDLELARMFPQLDVIIGAHTHTVVETPVRVGKTLVCQAGSYGRYLGQLDMLVRDGDVAKHRGFLRRMDARVALDPAVQAVADEYASRLEEQLREVVAHAEAHLDGERDDVRSRETNLGNLVTDLYREYTRADVALVNSGGIRSSIAAGPITVGDVLQVAPFSNLIAVKEVTGAQLRRALEFAARIERPHGGFPQVSGMSIVIEGDRLVEVTVGGEPLDDEKTYTLAAPEFLLAGGDGYHMLTEGAPPVYLGFTDNTILMQMLRLKRTVNPQVEGRIVIR